MSEKLKSIYHSGEVRIDKDVELTVDVVERIVSNITPKNVNKAPEVRKRFSRSLSFTTWQLFKYGFFSVTLYLSAFSANSVIFGLEKTPSFDNFYFELVVQVQCSHYWNKQTKVEENFENNRAYFDDKDSISVLH